MWRSIARMVNFYLWLHILTFPALLIQILNGWFPIGSLHNIIGMHNSLGLKVAAFSWKEPMQSTRQSSERLGLPDRPGRWNNSVGFSPKGGLTPAVDSLLLLRAGDIETNPRPHCYACGNPVRHGTLPLRWSTVNCPGTRRLIQWTKS